MRFFSHIRELSETMTARLTQLDYNREMALVALAPGTEEPEALGVVRLMADPDNQAGEFAVTVRSDFKGFGLGRALMERIIDYGAERGLSEIWGDVLAANRPMLTLCEKLGFERGRPNEGVVKVTYAIRRDR